ncbi:MAG: hypothetical protein ACRDPZ_11760 [Gaiellaceae bacterium]
MSTAWVFVVILLSVSAVVTVIAMRVSGFSLRASWIEISLGITIVIVAVVALVYVGLRENPRDPGISVSNAPP